MFGSSFSRSYRDGNRPVVISSASQLPNLEVWYDASQSLSTTFNSGVVSSGASITSWHNTGGLSSHDWNSTGGNRPTWVSPVKNGLGVVRFDGISQNLTINPTGFLLAGSGVGLSATTLVILFKTSSIASGVRYATSTDKGGWQWGQNGTQYIGGFAGATFTVDAVTADTNFHHIILTFDGTKTGNANRLKARLDGADVNLTFTGTVGATTSGSTAYFYGGCTGTKSNDQNSFWNGDLGEVLIWTRALSTSDTLAVEQYLTTKWAV